MDFKVNPAVTETSTTYTVTLTEKEAAVIASLIGAVTGSEEESEFRRVIEDLWGSGFREIFYSKFFRSVSPIPAPRGAL